MTLASFLFFFSSRRRHTRYIGDWSSDVCSSDLELPTLARAGVEIDVLVGSGEDETERYRPGDLDPAPKIVVTTAGDEDRSEERRVGKEGRYRGAREQ